MRKIVYLLRVDLEATLADLWLMSRENRLPDKLLMLNGVMLHATSMSK